MYVLTTKSRNSTNYEGVPQESVLSALLFLTYIIDFVNTSTLFNFILFADDASIISKMYAKNVNLFNKCYGYTTSIHIVFLSVRVPSLYVRI